jgi:hypothetical protein
MEWCSFGSMSLLEKPMEKITKHGVLIEKLSPYHQNPLHGTCISSKHYVLEEEVGRGG